MAENQIDFGQTSTPQYSLRGFLNKQETAMPIAQDIAQAIQVTHNAYKMYSQVEDDAQQAKYFNANIEFNNLKKQQQDALGSAGEDVNKIREVLDTYKPQIEGLSDKYQLNDKYKSTLGGAIESHNSGWEEKYRGYYNAQQDSIATANIADVTRNMIGTTKPEDIPATLQGLKEYYKVTTGKDDRQASSAVATPFINAKLSSLQDEELTWEQAKTIKKEMETNLLKFDGKLASDSKFREALNLTDAIQEQVRKREEGRVADMIKAGDRPLKTMETVINRARADGIILTDEHAAMYKAEYKDKLLDKDAKNKARRLIDEGRTADDFKYKFALSGKSEEEAKTYLDSLVSEGKMRKDRAGYILRDYKHDLDKQLAPKIAAVNKEAYAKLKVSGSTDGYTLSQVETLARSTSKYGSLGVDDLRFIQEFQFREIAEKAPNKFMDAGILGVSPEYQQQAMKVADNKIDEYFQKGDMEAVSKLHNNYGVKGNISTFFSKALVDPKNFKTIAQNYEAIKQMNPASYQKIVGEDNALKIEAVRRLQILSGSPTATPDIYLKAEQQMKQPILLSRDQLDKQTALVQSEKITDIAGFTSDIKGFMQVGMTFSEAKDEAIKKSKANTFGTFNFTGIEQTVTDKAKGQISDDFTTSFTNKNSKVIGAVFNKATNTMWWSEKNNSLAYDTKQTYNEWVRELHNKAVVAREVTPETLQERLDRKRRNIGTQQF